MPTKKPDYYAILGLAGNASDGEIRAAYKKLVRPVVILHSIPFISDGFLLKALQWHPDRHLSGKEHAAQKFIKVRKPCIHHGRSLTSSFCR